MKKIEDKQIRIHGRSGQGVVALAEILANAFFIDGYQVQAFPSFGVERSGAPILSFVRISRSEILTREHIYEPDILLVLDFSLVGKIDIFSGLKADGLIIVNTKLPQAEAVRVIKKAAQLPAGFDFSRVISVDASRIALAIFGQNLVNTAMLGAIAKIPGLMRLSSARQALKEKFSDKGREVVEKNISALNQVADQTII